MEISNDLTWWITMIELPVITALFWLIWQIRAESQRKIEYLQRVVELRSEQLRDSLAAFKLEAAQNYASQTALRDLESRLVQHLLRIEAKLDKTALKAEALQAKSE
jgi:hypothetical protein